MKKVDVKRGRQRQFYKQLCAYLLLPLVLANLLLLVAVVMLSSPAQAQPILGEEWEWRNLLQQGEGLQSIVWGSYKLDPEPGPTPMPTYIYYVNEINEIVKVDYQKLIDDLFDGDSRLRNVLRVKLSEALIFKNVYVQDAQRTIDYEKAISDGKKYIEAYNDPAYSVTAPVPVKELVINPVTGEGEEITIPSPDPTPDPDPDSVTEFRQELWLTIPSLGISTAVANGDPWQDEESRPQHFGGVTPNIGNATTHIAGYRLSHGGVFSELESLLESLALGHHDIIYLEYLGKRYTYIITDGYSYVPHEELSRIYEGYDDGIGYLTLSTFYTIFPDYNADVVEDGERYIVVAKLFNIEDSSTEADPNPEYRQNLWLVVPKMNLNTQVEISGLFEYEESDDPMIPTPTASPSPKFFSGDMPDLEVDSVYKVNTVIGGFRESNGGVFGNIELIEFGDIIYLEYLGKRYTFEVFEIRPEQHNSHPIGRAPHDQLVSLMTFNPPGDSPTASEWRYYVHALLLEVEE